MRYKKIATIWGWLLQNTVLYFRSIKRGRYCFKNSNFGESRIWIKLEKIYRIVHCHKLTISLMTILKLFKHKFYNLISIHLLYFMYTILSIDIFTFFYFFYFLFLYIQTMELVYSLYCLKTFSLVSFLTKNQKEPFFLLKGS